MDDLSLMILDLVQNAITAKAKHIEISLNEKPSLNTLSLMIKDDGCGMSKNALDQVIDPFYTTRTTRKVGLGIPFIKQLTELTEGSFDMTSDIGIGTKMIATFKLNHIDLPPLGDLIDTLYLLICHQESFNFTFKQSYEDQQITIQKMDILNLIDGLSIFDYQVQQAIKSYMQEIIDQLKGETL